jgi:hypothetical protein
MLTSPLSVVRPETIFSPAGLGSLPGPELVFIGMRAGRPVRPVIGRIMATSSAAGNPQFQQFFPPFGARGGRGLARWDFEKDAAAHG